MDEISKVTALLEAPLAKAGYDLASVKLTRDRDGLTLHVAVDRLAPISLDDIVEVSDLINPLLDAADPIEGPYTLDVSSLGAEKPIKPERLGDYVGRYVNLHLSCPCQGENVLEGVIASVGDDIVIRVKNKTHFREFAFPAKNVDKARLAIEL
ncbi:MAG: ribosome maturation factor RimP [Bacilli bacterium]|jgi:ribosome maturation factor RimP|nr:ribosome maturation factor RimP [Bacilli bacterium]